jgi:hypothetical protein
LKDKYFWIILVVVILIPILIVSLFAAFEPFDDPNVDVFVGISVAYDNVEEIKLLVDEVSSYINTIVIGSTGITFDMAKLDDVCQYVYDKGLYFMIYAHPIDDPEELLIQRQWVLNAKPRWGKHFLGLYAFDEPGGRQLDNASYKVVKEDWFADNYDNYTEAADKYVNEMFIYLHHLIEDQMGGLDLPLFTSDYALYWFDYKAHYDVVFAEFGWNYSRHLNVALCRGAANVQNKDWGVMITWTYTQPPYLEPDNELYDDLVLAYENCADYILVFDTNEDYTQSVLTSEHKAALKRFWRYAGRNPRAGDSSPDRVAYVLPEGYGYGFRGPNDTIWGLWEADDFSFEISTQVGALINKYQNRLDIIYDDGLETNSTYGYSKIIFWNGTVLNP